MLASIPPRRVAIPPVGDRRIDAARIGSRSKDGSAIVTTRPVTDVVHGALVLEITRNGHAVVPGGADFTVTAAVEAFWLDEIRTYPGTQYVGRVAITVAVSDGREDNLLLTRRCIGIVRRLADKTSADDWRGVMDLALSRAVHDFATDPALVSTLGRTRTTAGGPAGATRSRGSAA